MREHELKTWPSAFDAVLSGVKRFEYRRNDRDFAVGDALVLKEWDPTPTEPSWARYTEREIRLNVTYILHGGQFGIPEGFCVMSIKPAEAT